MNKREGKAKFRALRAAVSEVLREADPVGLIEIGAPRDEYDPEVGTILPRLRDATSASDVHRILHEEFVRSFGKDVAEVQSAMSRQRIAYGQSSTTLRPCNRTSMWR